MVAEQDGLVILAGGPMVAERDGLASRRRRLAIILAGGPTGATEGREMFYVGIVGTYMRKQGWKVRTTKITMADEDNNRFERNPTWINWMGLDNGSVLQYCQKDYHKPRYEEDLKRKIKDKMKQSDEKETKETQGR
jgi:hypothetical protein